MSRMFLGLKSGLPVLKIMADANDDPLTTPNSDFEKFRFNSENTDYSYAQELIFWDTSVTTYYPSGRGPSDYVLKCESGTVYCNAFRAIDYYGFLPLIQHRFLSRPGNKAYYFSIDNLYPGNPYGMARIKKQSGIYVSATFRNTTGYPDDLVSALPPLNNSGCLSIITRFPCDRDYTALSGTPVSGHCFATFDEKRVRARVARAGYDARTASRFQCLIHEDQRPISICAHGSVTIPASTTVTVPIGVEVPDGAFPYLHGTITTSGTILSFSYPRAGTLVFPAMSLEAHIVDNDIVITNSNNTSIAVYYSVMVEDAFAPTSGGSGKILNSNEDGIKILRPGASTPLVASDILLSSDYRYCPLVAYGTIPDTAFSGTSGVLQIRTASLNLPAMTNKPIILTALQKVGATSAFNDGDVLIDAYWKGAFFGTINPLTYYWEHDPAANKINFTVVDCAGSGWLIRYYILAVPN